VPSNVQARRDKGALSLPVAIRCASKRVLATARFNRQRSAAFRAVGPSSARYFTPQEKDRGEYRCIKFLSRFLSNLCLSAHFLRQDRKPKHFKINNLMVEAAGIEPALTRFQLGFAGIAVNFLSIRHAAQTSRHQPCLHPGSSPERNGRSCG
jgi:hypothetical protein